MYEINRPHEQIRNQIGIRIRDQAKDNFFIQLKVGLWNKVWYELGNQAGIQIWDNLRDNLYYQIRNFKRGI
jgi:hypothetical protein